MRLVKQLNEIDCGIAVAAMIASVNYEAARKADNILFPLAKTGLSPDDLKLLIYQLSNQNVRITRRHYKKPLIDFIPKINDRAILIRENKSRYGHWIAISNNMIYDPEHYICKSIKNYERNAWEIIRILSA
jgi:hypothetical protein